MPSPFPGMNPYLEADGVWHTVHQQLCVRCYEALVPQVRPKYIVQTDENVYIHELGADERGLLGRPDAYISQVHHPTTPHSSAGTTLSGPLHTRIPYAIEEERVSYLKILDRKSRELITVVEILSPVNKGSGRGEYLAKRKQYLDARIGMVEIDLLRAGRKLPLEQSPDCDYLVTVVRPQESPEADIWPIQLHDLLPTIPIPLRAGDGDAELNLQDLLNQIYDAGGYADHIYDEQPDPPLPQGEAQWAKQFVPQPR